MFKMIKIGFKRWTKMYVVTQSGHKLPVDSSSIPEDEYGWFQQNVGLYDDNTILKEVWILELDKKDYEKNGQFYELEFVKELRYDHEPTQEEILWAMSAYGCSRWSVAFVKKGYELDMKYDY